MYSITIDEKDHEFEREYREIYGRVWRMKEKGEIYFNENIKYKFKTKNKNHIKKSLCK